MTAPSDSLRDRCSRHLGYGHDRTLLPAHVEKVDRLVAFVLSERQDAAREEREACAQLIEHESYAWPRTAASAIRSRGQSAAPEEGRERE